MIWIELHSHSDSRRMNYEPRSTAAQFFAESLRGGTKLCAIFQAVEASEAAMEALKLSGFCDTDLSALYTGNVGSARLDDQRITDETPAAEIAAGKRVAPALEELGLPPLLAERYGRRIAGQRRAAVG
jgi:hypothetical protein